MALARALSIKHGLVDPPGAEKPGSRARPGNGPGYAATSADAKEGTSAEGRWRPLLRHQSQRTAELRAQNAGQACDNGPGDLSSWLAHVGLQNSAGGGRSADCAAAIAYNAQLQRDSAATLLLDAGIPIDGHVAKCMLASVVRGDAAGASVHMQRFVEQVQCDGLPIDINALVQWVLRDSYMQTTWDLQFYADKVKFYNDVKKQIRERLDFLRELSAKYAGVEEGTVMDSSDFAPVLDVNTDFYGAQAYPDTTLPRGERQLGDPATLAEEPGTPPVTASSGLHQGKTPPADSPIDLGSAQTEAELAQAKAKLAESAPDLGPGKRASKVTLFDGEQGAVGKESRAVADSFLQMLDLEIGQLPQAAQEAFFADLKKYGGLTITVRRDGQFAETVGTRVRPQDYDSLDEYFVALAEAVEAATVLVIDDGQGRRAATPTWRVSVSTRHFRYDDPSYPEGIEISRNSQVRWSEPGVSGGRYPDRSSAAGSFVAELRAKIEALPYAAQMELFNQLVADGLAITRQETSHGSRGIVDRKYILTGSTAGCADWGEFFAVLEEQLSAPNAPGAIGHTFSAALPEFSFFDRNGMEGRTWREDQPEHYYEGAVVYGAAPIQNGIPGADADELGDPEVPGDSDTIPEEDAIAGDTEVPAITGVETIRLEMDFTTHTADEIIGINFIPMGVNHLAFLADDIVGTGNRDYDTFLDVIRGFLGQFLMEIEPLTPERERLLLEQFSRQPITLDFSTTDNPNKALLGLITTDGQDSYWTTLTSALKPKPGESLQDFLGRIAVELGRQAITYVRDANDGAAIDIGRTAVSGDMPTLAMMTQGEAEENGYFIGGTGIGGGDSDGAASGLAEGEMRTVDDVKAEIERWEEELSSVGDDAQLANIDLQNQLQKQQQTLQTISNISKTLHDTAMSLIRNING